METAKIQDQGQYAMKLDKKEGNGGGGLGLFDRSERKNLWRGQWRLEIVA